MSPRMSGLYSLEKDGGPAACSDRYRKPDHQPEGRIWPSPKSGCQLANPIDRVRRNLSAHKRTHEYGTHTGWAAAALQIEYFAFQQEEAGQSRGQPAQDITPLWRRLSYCVVSFMQQGKVQGSISYAPPNHHLSLAPQSPPECRRVLSASVGEMESVPVLSTRSPRDVAPRRAVTASASK